MSVFPTVFYQTAILEAYTKIDLANRVPMKNALGFCSMLLGLFLAFLVVLVRVHLVPYKDLLLAKLVVLEKALHQRTQCGVED